MGLEAKVKATHKTVESMGKLHVDSTALVFSSKELKWSVSLSSAISATAADGILTVKNGRDKIVFEVGETADRWIEKILNPPSRMKKLGVKAGMRYWIEGGFDRDFIRELEELEAISVRSADQCDIAFWYVDSKNKLNKLETIQSKLKQKVNLWIMWPKGVTSITQTDVMTAANECGMGPSKTAAFDTAVSSMRFAKRG